MLTHAGGNMVSAVKAGVIRKFLDGDLPWTACRDSPSVAACIELAATQARELAEAGDRVAQYQLGRDDGYLDKDVAMLRRAAEGGFVLAQISMGFRLKKSEQWAEAGAVVQAKRRTGTPDRLVSTRTCPLQRTRGDPQPRAGLRTHTPRGPKRTRQW